MPPSEILAVEQRPESRGRPARAVAVTFGAIQNGLPVDGGELVAAGGEGEPAGGSAVGELDRQIGVATDESHPFSGTNGKRAPIDGERLRLPFNRIANPDVGGLLFGGK